MERNCQLILHCHYAANLAIILLNGWLSLAAGIIVQLLEAVLTAGHRGCWIHPSS